MILQHDIAGASIKACRLNYEKTHVNERSAQGLRDVMNGASKVIVKSKLSNYDKMLSIANPKHRPQFLQRYAFSVFILQFVHLIFICCSFHIISMLKINAHPSAEEKPEITQEKL